MTLTKAIKTGKPFKRPHHDTFLEFNESGHLSWYATGGFIPTFLTKDSLLATDWIVKGPRKKK